MAITFDDDFTSPDPARADRWVLSAAAPTGQGPVSTATMSLGSVTLDTGQQHYLYNTLGANWTELASKTPVSTNGTLTFTATFPKGRKDAGDTGGARVMLRATNPGYSAHARADGYELKLTNYDVTVIRVTDRTGGGWQTLDYANNILGQAKLPDANFGSSKTNVALTVRVNIDGSTIRVGFGETGAWSLVCRDEQRRWFSSAPLRFRVEEQSSMSLTRVKWEDSPINLDLGADFNDKSVTLHWTQVPAADRYEIYQNDILMAFLPAPMTAYTVSGLTNGTEYEFKVIAANASGSWPESRVKATPNSLGAVNFIEKWQTEPVVANGITYPPAYPAHGGDVRPRAAGWNLMAVPPYGLGTAGVNGFRSALALTAVVQGEDVSVPVLRAHMEGRRLATGRITANIGTASYAHPVGVGFSCDWQPGIGTPSAGWIAQVQVFGTDTQPHLYLWERRGYDMIQRGKIPAPAALGDASGSNVWNGASYSPAQWHWITLEVTATTVNVKIWAGSATTVEPSEWAITVPNTLPGQGGWPCLIGWNTSKPPQSFHYVNHLVGAVIVQGDGPPLPGTPTMLSAVYTYGSDTTTGGGSGGTTNWDDIAPAGDGSGVLLKWAAGVGLPVKRWLILRNEAVIANLVASSGRFSWTDPGTENVDPETGAGDGTWSMPEGDLWYRVQAVGDYELYSAPSNAVKAVEDDGSGEDPDDPDDPWDPGDPDTPDDGGNGGGNQPKDEELKTGVDGLIVKPKLTAVGELILVPEPPPTKEPLPHARRYPAVGYTYLVADLLTGAVLDELPLSEVSYEHVLNGPGSMSGKLSLLDRSATAANLAEGKRAIFVVRNGGIVWSGILWTVKVDTDADGGGTVALGAEGFWSYFRRRVVRVSQQFRNRDRFDVVRTLIYDAQHFYGETGSMDVVLGVDNSSVNVDADFWAQDRHTVADAVEALASLDPAFDFGIRSYFSDDGQPVRVLELSDRRGTRYPANGLVFELDVNVKTISETRDATRQANVVEVVGAGEYPRQLTSTVKNIASGAPALEDVLTSNDTTKKADLTALGNTALLASTEAVRLPVLTVDATYPGCAPDQLNVGDECWVLARRGLLQLNTKYRMTAISVKVADDHTEELSVTLANINTFRSGS